MAQVFADNFSGYSPGNQNPTNFVSTNGDPNIVAFSTMTGSSEAVGFYERLGQGCQLTGDMMFQTNGTAYTVLQANIMGWQNFAPFSNTTWIAFDNANLTGTNAGFTNLAGFQRNSDMTFSLYINGTNSAGTLTGGNVVIANTQEQVVTPFTWHYVQAWVGIGINAGYVTVSGTLAIDGVIQLTGFGETIVVATNLWTGLANCNQIRFPGQAFTQRILGDMSGYAGTTGSSDIIGAGTYVFGTSPIHQRFTQGVVESVQQTRPGNARYTQGAVEWAGFPSHRNARFTQGVVEIVRPYSPNLIQWILYEA